MTKWILKTSIAGDTAISSVKYFALSFICNGQKVNMKKILHLIQDTIRKLLCNLVSIYIDHWRFEKSV